MTAVLERKKVELSRTSFLVLDCDGTSVRGAHYYLRPPAGLPGADEPSPSPLQMDAGKEQGWFKPGAKREAWCRVAVERETLADLCFVLFQGSSQDWQTVEAYLRATAWGAELP